MGKPGPATQAKRNRERAQAERKEEKQAKKSARKELGRKDRDQLIADGVDPDLAGIIPGPQPIPSFDQ